MTPDQGKSPTGVVAYEHLGRFSNWVGFAQEQGTSIDGGQGAVVTPAAVREVLGFADDQLPVDVRREHAWERDGVIGGGNFVVGRLRAPHSWLVLAPCRYTKPFARRAGSPRPRRVQVFR